MSAHVVALRDTAVTPPVVPPAIAQARQIAQAYEFLGDMADRLGRIAAGGRPLPPPPGGDRDLLLHFMEVYYLVTGDRAQGGSA